MAKEQGVNRGMITAIGAVSSNNMLGLAGWLPWDIPEELAYFEKTVAGAALLIGRLTYESMDVVPEPSFIVSRQLDLVLRPGCTRVDSVEQGLSKALKRASRFCHWRCVGSCRGLAVLSPVFVDPD